MCETTVSLPRDQLKVTSKNQTPRKFLKWERKMGKENLFNPLPLTCTDAHK
jgi:hypothetical protein